MSIIKGHNTVVTILPKQKKIHWFWGRLDNLVGWVQNKVNKLRGWTYERAGKRRY